MYNAVPMSYQIPNLPIPYKVVINSKELKCTPNYRLIYPLMLHSPCKSMGFKVTMTKTN